MRIALQFKTRKCWDCIVYIKVTNTKTEYSSPQSHIDLNPRSYHVPYLYRLRTRLSVNFNVAKTMKESFRNAPGQIIFVLEKEPH